MYVVWAFIVILLFLHFDLSEIIAFAYYTSTACPLQKHAHYPCFTLVASEDPVSVAVCLSSPEAGDILHGRPDASSVTMQFSLVHEARNSAAPLISDRTSCIREDKQDLRIYFGCCMLPCRSDQQQSINLSFESKFIR